MASGRSFVSPIALFLFSVFLMFAVFSLVGGPVASSGSPEAGAEARADILAEFEQEGRARRTEIAELRRQRAEAVAAGRATAAIDAGISRLEQRQRSEERAMREALALIDAGAAAATPPPSKAGERPKAEPVVLVPNARPEQSRVIDLSEDEIDTGWPLLDRGHREGEGQSAAARLQAADQRLQILLGADPDLGAVRLAAVPAPAALPRVPRLRPCRVRDLFDLVHEPCGDRAEPAAAARHRRA